MLFNILFFLILKIKNKITIGEKDDGSISKYHGNVQCYVWEKRYSYVVYNACDHNIY